MSFDPDIYTITIRKETVDGEMYFVGRVAEFPNISAYENSHEEALEVIRGSLTTVAKHAEEAGRPMPQPAPGDDEVSGRITLRMAKSTHAKVNQRALLDDTSATQLINTAISYYLGEATALDSAYRIFGSAVQQALMEQQKNHLLQMLRLTAGPSRKNIEWTSVSNEILARHPSAH